MPHIEKLQSIQVLPGRLAARRAEGCAIVHTHGTFDLLHIGAVRHLEQARQLGDDSAGNWFLTAIMLDGAHRSKPEIARQALAAYRKFLSLSDGKNPNQEFQARQRAKILQRELDKR